MAIVAGEQPAAGAAFFLALPAIFVWGAAPRAKFLHCAGAVFVACYLSVLLVLIRAMDLYRAIRPRDERRMSA